MPAASEVLVPGSMTWEGPEEAEANEEKEEGTEAEPWSWVTMISRGSES
jgi:hypothetical protein